MALDPQCRAMLDVVAENGSPFDDEDPAKAREMMAATTRPVPDPDERFADVHDNLLTGPVGDMAYRYYRPNDTPETLAPCIIYYHGGGMVFGTIDSHDPICRAIAVATDCVVISIDHRLAPEDKFPSAVDDAWAAYTEIRTHSDDFGVDPNRIAVGGDSAGGNLAATVALAARDRGGPVLCGQAVLYPGFRTDGTLPSFTPYGEAPLPIVIALSITAAGTIALFFYPEIPIHLAQSLIGR